MFLGPGELVTGFNTSCSTLCRAVLLLMTSASGMSTGNATLPLTQALG